MKMETPYFSHLLKHPSDFFFENRVMADKLAHVKGFRRHPLDFIRHHYYSVLFLQETINWHVLSHPVYNAVNYYFRNTG